MNGLAPASGRIWIQEAAEFRRLIDDTEKCMPRSSLVADIAIVVDIRSDIHSGYSGAGMEQKKAVRGRESKAYELRL